MAVAASRDNLEKLSFPRVLRGNPYQECINAIALWFSPGYSNLYNRN